MMVNQEVEGAQKALERAIKRGMLRAQELAARARPFLARDRRLVLDYGMRLEDPRVILSAMARLLLADIVTYIPLERRLQVLLPEVTRMQVIVTEIAGELCRLDHAHAVAAAQGACQSSQLPSQDSTVDSCRSSDSLCG